jgi:addiction module HigA family antidote
MHPGEVLREEFLAPLGMSAGALAKAIDVPRTRIERIASENVGITADTAMRLAKYFGTSVEFWTNLQTDYDIQVASKRLATVLGKIKAREAVNENPAPLAANKYLKRA